MKRLAARFVLAAALGAMTAARAAERSSCAWALRLDSNVNTLFPDQNAYYWITALAAAPGARLTIRGRYPHSRYISFASYTGAAQSIDGLNDQRIAPDADGSVNPFIAGNRRDTEPRNYTVTVVFGQRPANAPDNVLYTTNADGSKSARLFFVWYRVFRPDDGRDVRGGVPLPSVAVTYPGAGTFDLPACDAPDLPPNGLNQTIAEASFPWPPVFPYPGTDPPTWHRFYNAPTSFIVTTTENGVTGDDLSAPFAPLTMQSPPGGLGDNPDNAYIHTILSPYYGRVAVLAGKLPTFPHTVAGEPTMAGGTQLRYWSLCTYEALTERYYGCLVDDQVKTAADGSYRVIVSSAANRPACADGYNWLPAGPASDTMLLLRNMLPDPSFANAIQNVRVGHEAQDMGPYFPAPHYDASPACD